MRWLRRVSIKVHACEVCGDHAKEVSTTPGRDYPCQKHYEVEPFLISVCHDCRMFVCQSCLTERDCCAWYEGKRELAESRKGLLFD